MISFFNILIVFQTYKDLRDHVECVHSDEFKPFTCTICDFGANTKAALVKHFQNSHPAVSLVNDTPWPSILHAFFLIAKGEETYQCNFCPSLLGTPDEKEAHETDNHPLESTGYCQDCHKKFESKIGLFRHIQIHHDKGYGLNRRKEDGGRPAADPEERPKTPELRPVTVGVVVRHAPEKPGPQTQPFKCLSAKVRFG